MRRLSSTSRSLLFPRGPSPQSRQCLLLRSSHNEYGGHMWPACGRSHPGSVPDGALNDTADRGSPMTCCPTVFLLLSQHLPIKVALEVEKPPRWLNWQGYRALRHVGGIHDVCVCGVWDCGQVSLPSCGSGRGSRVDAPSCCLWSCNVASRPDQRRRFRWDTSCRTWQHLTTIAMHQVNVVLKCTLLPLRAPLENRYSLCHAHCPSHPPTETSYAGWVHREVRELTLLYIASPLPSRQVA